MAEKGKVINITCDKCLNYQSLIDTKDAFTVTANELEYTPDGELVPKEYAVIDVDIKGTKVKKQDLTNGTHNNTELVGSHIKLHHSENNYDEKYTATIETTENMVERDLTFKVVGGPYKIRGFQYAANKSTSYTFTLYNADKSMVLATRTLSLTEGIWTDIIFDTPAAVTNNTNYILHIEWTTAHKVLNDATLWDGEYMEVINDRQWQNATTYFDRATTPSIGILVTVEHYDTSGYWLYPFDCNTITAYHNSICKYVSSILPNTNISVETGINTSGITPPTVWVGQTSGEAISNLTQGEDLTGKYVWLKVTLSTTDWHVSPSFTYLDTRIVSGYPAGFSFALLIDGWAGFNKAYGDITVAYDAAIGTIIATCFGTPKLQSFSEAFTPVDLLPINDPANVEAGQATALVDITRSKVTFEKGYTTEAGQATAAISITRTHIDDLPP